MHYLSSCSIVKNEDFYIDDFVRIHKALGVEFFLFFDRSENPLSERFKGRDDIQVIHYPDVKAALKKRRYQQMLMVDLAVPRDIAPKVESLDGVYLYGVDDLQ